MKIKIVSDGTGIRAVTEAGEPLEGVTGITWSVSTGEGSVATVTFAGVPMVLASKEAPRPTQAPVELLKRKDEVERRLELSKADEPQI